MRVVRLWHEVGPSWGLLSGQRVQPVAGSPYDGPSEPCGEPVPLETVRLLPPATPSKILAVGRNYAEHVAEMSLPTAEEPAIFMKPPSALLEPGGTVLLPDREVSSRVEHEAELAVVIGRTLARADVAEAATAIFGFTCADDVTARDLQRTDVHITRAKGFDTFLPLGPWIETALAAGADIEIRCRVNGETRQAARTSHLVHDVPSLLSHISQWATLLPGDVVLTGTPAGTGPLRDGDRVEVEIEGVGLLPHGVARRRSDRPSASS